VVGTESLHVGMVTAQDFDTVITYINTLGSTKILSNPKLVVTNNQESRIHVGEKQAYVTTTTTTGQVTSTVAENVTFVDVGTQLAVTPTINDDGFITMKVKAEISAVVDTLVTPTKNEIPIINSSLAETTVMVKDGTTVIIGGLKDEVKVKGTTKTPYLGDIPLLGWLFKVSRERLQKTDLLIMLTPRIVTGEIFVTEAGKTVEEPAIKDIQDYQSLNPMPAPVNCDVDPIDRKTTFKGLRTVN
jgi:general secretion pathway protein D